jgi:excisionase family DNA binding protein
VTRPMSIRSRLTTVKAAVEAAGMPRISYRVHDAARHTGLSVRTLWRRIEEGKLRAVRDEGSTLILADDLNAYLASLPEARKAAQS